MLLISNLNNNRLNLSSHAKTLSIVRNLSLNISISKNHFDLNGSLIIGRSDDFEKNLKPHCVSRTRKSPAKHRTVARNPHRRMFRTNGNDDDDLDDDTGKIESSAAAAAVIR